MCIYYTCINSEKMERINSLIAEIEGGTKFVSMECIFSDFDYGLKSQDGTFHVIERNESTAFLTKHLRVYGGAGKYDDYTLGRKLKSPIFIGKGYVDNPANKPSKIFNDGLPFVVASVNRHLNDLNGVQSSNNVSENESMADEKLQAELDAANKKIAELEKTQISESSAKLQKELDSTKAEIDTVNDKVKTVETEKDALAEQVKQYKEQCETLETELKSTKESLATQDMNHTKMVRKASLIAIDMEEAEADKVVDKFIALSDDQWKDVYEAFAVSMKVKNSFRNEEYVSDFSSDSFIDRYDSKYRLSGANSLDLNANSDDDEEKTKAQTEYKLKIQKSIASLLGKGENK